LAFFLIFLSACALVGVVVVGMAIAGRTIAARIKSNFFIHPSERLGGSVVRVAV
jgi:hypothetical protein